MDEDQYLFVMRGYLGPFESNLKVQALNPTSVSDASFRVYGSYSTEWLSRIGEVAAKKIEDLGRSAERGIIDAQEALRRAEGKLNDAQREMDKIMHKIDNICTIHHCGTGKSKSILIFFFFNFVPSYHQVSSFRVLLARLGRVRGVRLVRVLRLRYY